MYLPFHEFSHSFVNPLTEIHREQLGASENLFTSLSETMQDQAYTSWETCVNEHLVRVNVIRIISDVAGMGGYMLENILLNQEKDRGFIYIQELNVLTKKYEENRNIYPAYSDFYTKILAFFNEKACSLQAVKE
jgi:hypothetical protein